MSTAPSDYGQLRWVVELLGRIGDVDRAHLGSDAGAQSAFLPERVVSPEEERAMSEVISRTCASLREGKGFAPADSVQPGCTLPADFGAMLVALHRNGREVSPDVLRKLEAHRQRIRDQRR